MRKAFADCGCFLQYICRKRKKCTDREQEKVQESIYLQEIAKYGVDNVVLLSPYRQKTETGVNALNQRIQGKVNPADPAKNEAVYGQRRFRVGDKVMQTKNWEEVNNGDVGYITSITGTASDAVVRIDFGDDRVVEYENSELEMLDLAYARTVHKSQGEGATRSLVKS